MADEEKKEFILGWAKWSLNRQIYLPKIIGDNLELRAGDSEIEFLVSDKPNEIRLRKRK